jgi:hypothetical protein
MVDKHAYYMSRREELLERYKWAYQKTKDDLQNDIVELYKRIDNLKIIIEAKDKYIEDLRKYIDKLKN